MYVKELGTDMRDLEHDLEMIGALVEGGGRTGRRNMVDMVSEVSRANDSVDDSAETAGNGLHGAAQYGRYGLGGVEATKILDSDPARDDVHTIRGDKPDSAVRCYLSLHASSSGWPHARCVEIPSAADVKCAMIVPHEEYSH
eukprot:2635108-Pyramimonas_sp.AAC.1